MKYCFYGMNPGAMTKYPAGVARELAERDPGSEFVFVVDDERGLSGVAFPEASTFVPRGEPSRRQVEGLLAQIEADALVTTAQRIPDSVFVSAARDRGIKTFMFQHGLYLPFMKREASLFVRKALKTWRYARYASVLAEMHDAPRLRYIRELSRVFVSGAPYSAANIDRDRMNVDRVLLNGEYWRTFHARQYDYPSGAQVVVGYPDYDQLAQIEAEPVRDGICYVAQTLVEHGRLNRSLLAQFLQTLVGAAGDSRLFIKLHPASDVSLYEEVSEAENVTLVRDALPRTTHYVGHYSTYLALVPFLSRNLLLWELEGHPIPDSIAPAGSVVTSDPAVLQDFVSGGGPHEPDAEHVARWNEYFFRGEETAFANAATEILRALKPSPGSGSA